MWFSFGKKELDGSDSRDDFSDSEGILSGEELLADDSEIDTEAVDDLCFEKVDRSRDVIYIPDIHGDPEALKGALRGFGLIDEGGNWKGEDAKVVFLGDLIDRGGRDREVLDYMIELKDQILEAGGEMVVLAGNHELFVLNTLYGNEMDYTVKLFRRTFKKNCLDLMGDFGFGEKATPDDFKVELLGNDKYSKYINFWRSMVPFDLENDVLAVHGSFNRKWVEKVWKNGVDKENNNFQFELKRGFLADWNQVPSSTTGGWCAEELASPMWMKFENMYDDLKEDHMFMYAGLKTMGVNLVVCGHQIDPVVRKFELRNVRGSNPLRFVCLDTAMSCGCGYDNYGKSNLGGMAIKRSGEVGFFNADDVVAKVGFDRMYDIGRIDLYNE